VANFVWDMETDVVVAGFGNAGGVASIEAHDAGSRVLLLEKGTYPGGASVLAGGSFKFVKNYGEAVKYFTTLSSGRVDGETIEAFTKGMSEILDYAQDLAKTDKAEIQVARERTPFASDVYPFPGRDSLGAFRVVHIPGFKSFPWLSGALNWGPAGFKMIWDNVEARGIKVMTETPAQRLLRNSSGDILGLVALLSGSKGREINIKAKKAVVLACGGFEQNEFMRLQYLQGKPFYSMAPLTHTGDGITMSQEVGAALWHMWHVHGSYGFKFDEYPLAFRHIFSGPRNMHRKMSWIVVDKRGRRYMDEYPPAPQDLSHRPMELYDADMPGYPRIPSYMIFDEEGRKAGPISRPMGLLQYYYEWSEDNSREVERGWILKANTIKALAQKIRKLPENEGVIDGNVLSETVSEWNECVDRGSDPLMRPPQTMAPLKTPPFYAAQVWPIITNTQGGPMHNGKQQVLDVRLKPIPRLYAVGELGSFFAHLYQLGGNLGETISSGRIAGRNAAREDPWD